MLVPILRKMPCNLRRMAACVTYRNRTRTKIAQHYHKSDLLSITIPNVAACRIYCTKSDSEPTVSLPMLVNAQIHSPSVFAPLKLLYITVCKITPNIDEDFSVFEFREGAVHASTLISKALRNKDYECLNGLVAEDMINILRAKIEFLSPNQRQLILLNEDNIICYVIDDIYAVTTDKTRGEHSITISTLCYYNPSKKENTISKINKQEMLICNYTFVRKYVNNVGGPWIVTFVNHYSLIRALEDSWK